MSEMQIDILSTSGGDTSSVTLPAQVFGCEVNVPLIHQVVVAQLAAARQGTHATKTRGMVSGGGAKPWRQKGTGRARHGSRRAPQWTGGGVVHGPQPRSYAQRTPKKMIAAALRSALSDRVADQKLFVVDSFVTGDQPSTRKALRALSAIGDYKSALVVLHRDEDLAWLSFRNVVAVHALAVDQLNVYDIIANEVVVFTKAALEDFLTRFPADEPEEVAEVKGPKKAAKIVKAEPAKAKPITEEPAQVEPEDIDEAPVDDVIADQAEVEVDEAEAEPAEVVEIAAEEEAAEVTDTEEADEVAEEVIDEAPAEAPGETSAYGEGSFVGENPPEGFEIKAKLSSKKFHTPQSTWYKRTLADVWFNSAEAASAAGFTDAMEGKK